MNSPIFAGDDVHSFADLAIERESFVLGEDVDAAEVGGDAVERVISMMPVCCHRGLTAGLARFAGERVKAVRRLPPRPKRTPDSSFSIAAGHAGSVPHCAGWQPKNGTTGMLRSSGL